MTQKFILVVADSVDDSGRAISAIKVAESRLATSTWALYDATRNRRTIKRGDKVVIYASGQKKGGMSFIASAKISEVISTNLQRIKMPYGAHFLSAPPASILRLDQVMLFSDPVTIQSLRSELSFVPAHQKWGVVLTGGCRRITDSDFAVITSRAG